MICSRFIRVEACVNTGIFGLTDNLLLYICMHIYIHTHTYNFSSSACLSSDERLGCLPFERYDWCCREAVLWTHLSLLSPSCVPKRKVISGTAGTPCPGLWWGEGRLTTSSSMSGSGFLSSSITCYVYLFLLEFFGGHREACGSQCHSPNG